MLVYLLGACLPVGCLFTCWVLVYLLGACLLVGRQIASRANEAGFQKVVFDRSGYRYHGRVAALADAARKEGLEF